MSRPEACFICDATEECECRRCIVCTRTRLAEYEPQTCNACIGRCISHLHDIQTLAQHLPAEAGEHANDPLPGGNSLVMLGPGSVGRDDLCLGDNAVNADPPVLAYELGRWEDDWRRTHHEPAAQHPMGIDSAAAYLRANTAWAAQWHPAFDEYAADLRRWRAVLISTLQVGVKPDRYVECLTCNGARLERAFTQPQPCTHPGPHRPTCDQGGRRDTWTCPRCGDTYTESRYWLAVEEALIQVHRWKEAAT